MKDGAEGFPVRPVDIKKLRAPNEEELQVYKKCISGSFFTGGIPFAMFTYYLSNKFKKPGNVQQPRPFLKNTIIFFANSLLGTFLCLPFCYSKFSSVYMKNIKKEEEEAAGGNVPATQLTEGTLPSSSVEDFSYPIDAVTQFNEPESNFSSDFSYSRLLEDDSDSSSAKLPSTTYSDLRARHRNEKIKPSTTPGSSMNIEKAPGTPSTPFSKIEETKEPLISSHPVKRNIYGDEIE